MRPKLNLKSKIQMSLSHEHVGSRILAKCKMYTLARAELLFTLCYEIPCTLLGPHTAVYRMLKISYNISSRRDHQQENADNLFVLCHH